MLKSSKRVLAMSVCSLVLAGCASDGSYNGPEIWNDNNQPNKPKEVWNTNGQVNPNPPKIIWRRADGSDVIPPMK